MRSVCVEISDNEVVIPSIIPEQVVLRTVKTGKRNDGTSYTTERRVLIQEKVPNYHLCLLDYLKKEKINDLSFDDFSVIMKRYFNKDVSYASPPE